MQSSLRNSGAINQETHQNFQIPCGILVDIFSRLPIKAIVLCKCVCKTWYDLISDDHFTYIYTERTPFTRLALLDVSYLLSRTGAPYLLEFEGKIEQNRSTRKLKSPKKELLPVSSCRGLLCLAEVSLRHDLFYINNPILDQYVVLPKANRCSYEETCTLGYGFGYSPLTMHCKVIRIVTQLRVGCEAIAKAEIYTVGRDKSWRNLDVSFIQYYFRSCAVQLEGALHWIVGKYVCTADFKTINQISTDFIVAFDIEEERFRTIPLPSELGNQRKQMRLTGIGNCLCVVDDPNTFQIDIWKMKEYGVVESWTKSNIMTSWCSLNEFSLLSTPAMIGIPGDEDSVLISDLDNHCLVSYNLKDNSWSKLEVCGTVLHGDFLPFAYDPSFVSMNDILRGQLRMLKI